MQGVWVAPVEAVGAVGPVGEVEKQKAERDERCRASHKFFTKMQEHLALHRESARARFSHTLTLAHLRTPFAPTLRR